MKLYIWIDAPLKNPGRKRMVEFAEVFIAVVADTFEQAVVTIQESYLKQYGGECPYILHEKDVHATFFPATKMAFIQPYMSDGG